MAGRWIDVTRHVLDDRYWILYEGRMVELAELDPHANATDRRAAPLRPLPSEGVPTTAATLAFGHDLGPLVGPDGGFSDPDERHKDPQENKE